MEPFKPDMEMRTPANLKYLKIGLLAFFCLAGVSAVYGIWWFVVANQFESSLDAWIEQQQAQGITVTYKRRTQSGFPNAIQIKLASPQLSSERPGLGTWSAEQLTLRIQPWAINHLAFDASGRHQWQDPSSGRDQTMQATARKMAGAAELTNGRLSSITSKIESLVIDGFQGAEKLQMAESEFYFTQLLTATPAFKIRLHNILLPPSAEAPLGDRIGHFDAKGTLNGAIEMRSWPQALVLWRDSGGTLDFDAIDLNYPPLRMRGDGTLALDEDMQPVAALSVKAEGFFEAIDALHGRGYIPLGTSFAVKIALGVMSVKPQDGSDAYLDLPISLQDQFLYAGSIKLLKLRPIHW